MMDSQESLKEQRKSQQRVSFKEPLKTGKHAWFDMIDQIQDQYSHMPRESEFRGSRNDLPRIRQSLKLQKTELIQEVKKEDDSRNLFATLKVITQYLIQEQTKKARAFKIGIFTVFIVVMVITMLKSVVASSPLLFVKIGQDAVGAIDFQLGGATNGLVKGNTNYYAIDPFNNPYAIVGRSDNYQSSSNDNSLAKNRQSELNSA